MSRASILVALALASWSPSAHAQHGNHQAPTPLPGAPTYDFGARGHLDHLAFRIEREANDACWEMYRNYQANPGWRETYAEMYKVLQDAKHIQQLVRDRYRATSDQDHIAADLREMDKLFHHVQDEVKRWQPDRAAGGFHHHDPRTAYHGDLFQKLSRFEETLHHLMTDYGVQRSNPQPAQGQPLAPGDSPPPLPPRQP
ncbi:MAG: hypothetical protein WD066_03560 [Planctomycetaceae bacterium]